MLAAFIFLLSVILIYFLLYLINGSIKKDSKTKIDCNTCNVSNCFMREDEHVK